MLSIFGPWPKRPESLFRGRVEIGELIISGDRLAAAGVGIVLIVVIIVMLRYSWAGKAIRAVSQDRETAAVVGINVRLTGMLAFGLGSALAGAAWEDIAPFYEELANRPLDGATSEVWLADWSRLEGQITEAASVAMIA